MNNYICSPHYSLRNAVLKLLCVIGGCGLGCTDQIYGIIETIAHFTSVKGTVQTQVTQNHKI